MLLLIQVKGGTTCKTANVVYNIIITLMLHFKMMALNATNVTCYPATIKINKETLLDRFSPSHVHL